MDFDRNAGACGNGYKNRAEDLYNGFITDPGKCVFHRKRRG